MHNFSLISPAGLHGVIRGAKRVIQVFVLLGLLLLSIAAVAESGQVSGKVADPHHAVISGAKVALTNRLTKKTVTVLTSDHCMPVSPSQEKHRDLRMLRVNAVLMRFLLASWTSLLYVTTPPEFLRSPHHV